MGYMLDTNICIYMMGRPTGPLVARANEHQSELSVSSITVAELLFGAAKSARREANRLAVEEFLEPIAVMPFDTSAAAHFGELRAHLQQAGTPVGPYDLLIGAHARSLGLTLVTNNRREFDRMPGLEVENWVA
jgi:tRNA(fMet)-specific endonuclease VapC